MLVEAGVHEFAAQLCEAMGVFAYVVVATVDESRDLVAYGKMGELVLIGGGLNGQLVMTPTEGNKLGYG